MRVNKLHAAVVAMGVLAFAGAADARSSSMSSSDVRHVQQALNDAGYDVRVDGKWGPGTERAMREYQRSHNLSVTGRADRDTLASMNIDMPRHMSGSSGTTRSSTMGRSGSPSEGGNTGVSHMGSGAKGSRTQTDTLTNPNTIPQPVR